MLVRDLIEQLSSMNPDATVHFVYDYGDHSHTQVAPEVNSVEEGTVKYNSYVNDQAVVDQEYDFGEGDGDNQLVVLLQA